MGELIEQGFTGKRKFWAFVIALACVTFLAWTSKLTTFAVDGIGWVLSAFVLGNSVEWGARAWAAKKEPVS